MRKPVFIAILSLCACSLAHAQSSGPVDDPTPPIPDITQPRAASALDTPIEGARIAPEIPDVVHAPSLEQQMSLRPGYEPGQKDTSARDNALRQAGWSYGARGGLAARSEALNEMLRRYAPTLDRVFDFRTVVLPIGNGGLMLRPPVVTKAQMAVAVDPSGQTARETEQIFEITRQGALVTAPPQWRTWLVRSVEVPPEPDETLRPRTRHEVEIWEDALVRGRAAGERQAVEIFLDDLARLQRDLVGMARYRLLLQAGKVRPPELTSHYASTQGGHDLMRVGDTTRRIREQPGLDADRAHWKVEEDSP
ncbi:type IV secretion system DotC family protein [Asaia krungthepensis]|uniref:Conjugal transfer protein DotC/TraI n=1 Tax=Asaia krungthepensis NRIC 0535 TaxID=1307925 RepID=A0ABQ0Q4K2_9PROT|nr:type IV secretion system DotC family protein [Asaia krungthepensis]GBQ91177.1 conjugal transfer protein DotC/TraI [Asaia krungthepensis NRIC 0535]